MQQTTFASSLLVLIVSYLSAIGTANQTYNVELGTTAVVRCGLTAPDYPRWSFTYPNGSQLTATSNADFNSKLPSYGRIAWVDRKHLEISSVTRADQGNYICAIAGGGAWTVQLQVLGMLFAFCFELIMENDITPFNEIASI